MKQKTGEDRVVLKKKLQDLEREWEEVCRVSVERQDRLEQAYRQIGQFHSHLGPLQSWMTKVLPMLDDSEPVHGDIDTTDDLMSAHSVSTSVSAACWNTVAVYNSGWANFLWMEYQKHSKIVQPPFK